MKGSCHVGGFNHLLVCWLAEPGLVHPFVSRSTELPGPVHPSAAADWPGEAPVWVNSGLDLGYAGDLSSDHPKTPLETIPPAAGSGPSLGPSGPLPTRGF